MPATDKAALQAITEKEYAKLQALIADIPDTQAMRKREEDTSIKDVIAHRAHWIDLFLGWYADGQAGKAVHFPAKGYKWNDLKRYNADLRARQTDLDWDGARALLAETHAKLVEFIDTTPALYVGRMKGATTAWTTGRFAEAAGASHYRSGAKWIRACLRADQ